MATTSRSALYYGSFIYCKTPQDLEYLFDAALVTDENGVILATQRDCGGRDGAIEKMVARLGGYVTDLPVQETKNGEFYYPGFVGELF